MIEPGRAAAPLPTAPLGDQERLACLRLIRSENVGPVTFRRLINHFGGADAALEALPELARRGGRKRLYICPRDDGERELGAARRIGARPLFTIEPGYPPLLAALDHPPPLIYAKGDTDLLGRPGVAIVGSRNCSAAGHTFARQVADGLSGAGLVIISGLARGIDAAAHQAALDGGTIAVLAGGLDVVYPPEHEALQAEISARGCLVSEMPPGFTPRAKDFPRRNRIISGLAYGVVIVEAARRSGTLTTARFANEQGREVFAVPGHPLDPRAEGTNRLIRAGATMITSAADVLETLRPMLEGTGLEGTGLKGTGLKRTEHEQDVTAPSRPAGTAPAEPEAQLAFGTSQDERGAVIAALGPAPVHVDDLLRATGLGITAVQVALLELDLAGRLEHHGAQLVSLKGPG